MENTDHFFRLFNECNSLRALTGFLKLNGAETATAEGLAGSSNAVIAAISAKQVKKPFLFVLSDKESAAYFFNDLENLLGDKDKKYENRNTFFFPASYKNPGEKAEEDKAGILLRSEVINRLVSDSKECMVVTWPEAIAEKVPSGKALKKNMFTINRNEQLSVDFLLELLPEYDFEHVDFVAEPGQFSVRGAITDVFSFSNDYPFRIEIMDNSVESLRTFNPETQLSVEILDAIHILPDIRTLQQETTETKECLLDSMPRNTILWVEDTLLCAEKIRTGFQNKYFNHAGYVTHEEITATFSRHRLIEFRKTKTSGNKGKRFLFHHTPQPNFNKHFELLIRNLEQNTGSGLKNILLFDSAKQVTRIQNIFESILENEVRPEKFHYEPLLLTLHEGFIDKENKLACYTDHQIFDRYHRYRIRDKFPGKEALSIKALYNLKPGDYVTHIDHGVGIFSGLEKIHVMGRVQEAIRLIYKNNDILYISIHSLHRIAKYTGKEGVAPPLHRLGSNAWNRLKEKTKKRVKDIAQDLIRLYAKRKAQKGYAFSPDSYLQHELEASFVFEDTPDQEKATIDIKKDMESPTPMDRLICGDVGFGKTEIAIRAAFKVVNDSKQVAVLVPTTILALQHYYTFTSRLRDFPCKIDYLSRFRSAAEKKQALKGAGEGTVDILIGTHRLLSKDIAFKDLGLLIIDEEQKFGVAAKEKLKQLRVNVDTLTLTATPIPRTLQFSLMGARDLSYLNTPPLNRYPIITEVHSFNEGLIKEAIDYELSRGGQVYFVHNRVQNIAEMSAIIQRVCPQATIAIAHGQLEGSRLEKIMTDFIHGEYDVLVSTSIIESGLDIPNANTIIINNAHHFGLSDLHQMRGRVGRTNKKAFCFLLSPPLTTLTDEARKRLKSIEEFSDLGSGFNIAMRDLDIRGAGNMLGAEQSGFITEVGLDTYHKILDEAIAELRETEFKGLFGQETDKQVVQGNVPDCHLETDLELMIPSDYVSNIEERLNLYKELDSISEKNNLDAFADKIKDRFGPLPGQVKGLLKAVTLRWKARYIGFEKVILKSGKMIAHMPDSNNGSEYYQSNAFSNILNYVQKNPKRSQIKETSNHLTIIIGQVQGIDEALEVITAISTPP